MKKSKFNLSHPASFTAKMGLLVPFCVLPDCLPGDVYRLGVRSFIRVQPMLAPLMHQVNFFTQWWFVPNRILWNNWQDFITGGEDGTAAPQFPTIKITPTTSSLADYMGLPVNNKELEVSALPFRAYAEIWNTRYRDQDLQLELPISYDDGIDTTTNTDLKRCSWAKDYFTTARPFTQRGAQISVPVNSDFSYNTKLKTNIIVTSYTEVLRNNAVINFKPEFFADLNFSGDFVLHFKANDGDSWSSGVSAVENSNIYLTSSNSLGTDVTFFVSLKIKQSITTDVLSTGVVSINNFSSPYAIDYVAYSSFNATKVDIRDLRLASATQRYQERSMQWGNRYEEFIQREFKVRPKDARIQRPEYLGGAKTRLQISEVLQTAEGTDTGVGTMRGHGVGAMSSRRIKFMTPEHGVIIGLFSIRPHSITTQGVNRAWRKFTKFDYFTPEFANVGMQEVFQSEIYADGTNFDTVFGYANRYDEYRKIPARISGEFRNLLDYWNLARIFDTPPVLNSSFIEMNPSTRIFAEQTQDQFLCMLQNDVFAYRPIPKRAKNILM